MRMLPMLPMLRRPGSLLAISFALLAPLVARPAHAQAGKFDLVKTKTVLTGLIEQSMKDGGVPSVSIALVRGDSIVWKAAFGYANVRMKTPATTETYYSTGSTFKSATATGIMQLVEQGKLKLDQPVNNYLENVRVQDRLQSEKQVTIRHILSHWSGLTAGAVTKPIWGRELPKTLEQMVGTLYSVRPPETKYEYNNFAYGLAGLLVQQVSGVEYEKYMVEHVLKPVGVMTPHPFRPTPEMVELMALPYLPGGSNGSPKPVEQVHFDVYPAGDIWLRPEEMARFLGAHLNGGAFQGKRIASEASIKATHEAQFGGTYAFGWDVKKDASGHTIIDHTGGIPGMSSYMLGDVDAKVGVYFMSNSGAPTSIGEAALKLLRGEEYVPPAPRKVVAVDAATLDRYAGVYEVNSDVAITLAREGANLTFRVNDQPANALVAESPTSFYSKGAPWTLSFAPNAAGVVDQFTLGTDDQKQVAKKKK
ncbi:MAG: serine hydrolase [Gemmatimonadaceae bacterium]